ncbi:MAG: FKBP-type peptidyl-prolyl cis-trans isomerase [Propionibacteriaceae bacterium]|nr:FKBP-type peptidyl-prolyl cis-trans isomerase [Propionibacteriaceae bacterium]
MPLTRRPVRILSTAAALLLSATLVACTGAPESTPTPTPSASATADPDVTPTPTPEPIPVSDSIDAITVAGEPGSAPEVTIPTPFAVDETRTRTLVEGQADVPVAEADSLVEVHYVGVNARTGEVFDTSWEDGTPRMFQLDQVVPGFTKGLTGTKAGQRILIVMPGTDGYDASGGNPNAGIQVGDSLAFVVDVVTVAAQQATGVAETPELPVTLGEADGKPTVTIDSASTPPAELLVAPVIRGAQRPVAAGEQIMVKYRAWSWKTGELVEDKFDNPVAGNLDDTIEAWKQGLVGQPLGSRLVLVAPPSLGYDKPSQNPPIEAGDTVVYVIDLLFSSAQG